MQRRYIYLMLGIVLGMLVMCAITGCSNKKERYKSYSITYTNGDIDTIVGRNVNHYYGHAGGYLNFIDTLSELNFIAGIRKVNELKEYTIKTPQFKLKKK